MFGLQEMKKVVYGGQVLEEENGGFSFVRVTKKQYDYFESEENVRFRNRMMCTAGVCLDFYTDAQSVSFDYEVYGMADRDIVQLDICQNGVLTGGVIEKPGIHTAGKLCHVIDRDTYRWNRITIWLPYMSRIILKNVQLSRGAAFRSLAEGTPDGAFAGSIRKKLLCYGDSITQGYDALHPSQSYAVRLARYFDMELWNAGLSGYIFDEKLLDRELPFSPDIVTVAFGTNDWNWAERKEQALDNAERYFDKVKKMYDGCRILYISPLWRGDIGVPARAGEFRAFCADLLRAAKDRGLETVDGYLAAPHREEAMADGILHPNDGGMACYSEYLTRVFLNGRTAADLGPGWRAEGY